MLTIHRDSENQVNDPAALALQALGWVLADDRRAERLLDLTGLTPDTLRESLGSRSTQRAVLEFLCSHEPDLLDAADALGVPPARLAAAAQELAR
ncbi:DUF3572 domain-containing protein [Alteraurantiacibacter buctensis]|uniref:DUF3572 domain-containing protein n=1 Tax=Alteraurantiacibacter buctensis TaxID=1503981 RepID=UPI00301B78A5